MIGLTFLSSSFSLLRIISDWWFTCLWLVHALLLDCIMMSYGIDFNNFIFIRYFRSIIPLQCGYEPVLNGILSSNCLSTTLSINIFHGYILLGNSLSPCRWKIIWAIAFKWLVNLLFLSPLQLRLIRHFYLFCSLWPSSVTLLKPKESTFLLNSIVLFENLVDKLFILLMIIIFHRFVSDKRILNDSR